jgi:hypothetical protein
LLCQPYKPHQKPYSLRHCDLVFHRNQLRLPDLIYSKNGLMKPIQVYIEIRNISSIFKTNSRLEQKAI